MLQYLTFIRLNIVYFINQVSRFMYVPTDYHMEVVKHILKYLKGTIGDRLTYIRTDFSTIAHHLSTYTDDDWTEDLDERRLVLGYCIYISLNLIF